MLFLAYILTFVEADKKSVLKIEYYYYYFLIYLKVVWSSGLL